MLLAACASQGDDSPVVARVADRELHQSALVGLVGDGISGDDSIRIVNNYIEQWIRQTVILVKAEKNIEDDFQRELQEYKDNLTVYSYERQIVDHLLDTAVSDSQIEEYYDAHKEDFHLKNSVVRAVYVAIPRKSPVVRRMKALVERAQFDDEQLVEMERMAAQHGLHGYFESATWIPFHTLQAAIPITTYNENLFLRQHRSVTLQDDSLCYVARILDYKVSDQVAPLDLQRDNIRAILLNHRKIEIIDSLHAHLLREAEEGDEVERYTDNKR